MSAASRRVPAGGAAGTGERPPAGRAVFVGRETEIARAGRALAAGRNLIVGGRYGMGRTALVEELSHRLAGRCRFVFCDFSREPAAICDALSRGLFGQRTGRRREPRFLALRGEILRRRPSDPRQHVLVLDDIARLTHPQADLLRRLADSFRLVAVIEMFLSPADRVRLASCLNPADSLQLGRLPAAQAREYFATVAARHGRDWSADQIARLARRSAGYPLRMHELRELALA